MRRGSIIEPGEYSPLTRRIPRQWNVDALSASPPRADWSRVGRQVSLPTRRISTMWTTVI